MERNVHFILATNDRTGFFQFDAFYMLFEEPLQIYLHYV